MSKLVLEQVTKAFGDYYAAKEISFVQRKENLSRCWGQAAAAKPRC